MGIALLVVVTVVIIVSWGRITNALASWKDRFMQNYHTQREIALIRKSYGGTPLINILSAPETPEQDRFFLLHEIELNTGVRITMEGNDLHVSRHDRKLVENYLSGRAAAAGQEFSLNSHLSRYGIKLK